MNRRLNVSAWAIRNPVPPVLLFVLLLVLGINSFNGLAVTRFPNIDVPVVQVAISQAGAAPTELETQVTKKVEDAIAGINGVKHINSSVVEGSSATMVMFELGVPVDRAVNDVKDAVARVRSELPRTIDEPVTQRLDIAGLPILYYAAKARTMTPEQLSWFIDDRVSRELQGVKGVGKIERIGGVEREIRVALDPDRLLALGLTAGDVNAQLRANNINLAGGRGEIGQREQAIRTLAGAVTLAELARTTIAIPGGRSVRLDALGKVTDTVAEPRQYAELNGEPVVAFAISRAKGASDVVVAKAVADKILALERADPGIELKLVDSAVVYTVGVYHSTMKALIEGALLAILVVFLFLRDLRATMIAAVALPLSIIPAFWAMDAMGFSLNLVSLLAITIVVGILVDDAIVEIENIVRHMRMGKSAYKAALEAADEIGLAVIAITATIIAVFAPVSFMGGIAGQYFKQFGLVVAAAVFFSLLVARFITPLMAAYLMHQTGREEHEGWLLRTYTRLVDWSVGHRIATVALGLMVFAGSILSMQLIPAGFLPAEDNGRILVALELPPGSRLADTRAVAARLAARLKARPEVTGVFVSGGRVLGSGNEVRKATLTVMTVPKEDRKLSAGALKQVFAAELSSVPDIRYWFLKEDGQRPFQMVVSGREGPVVEQAAAGIAAGMKRLPQVSEVVSTAEIERPELRVRPDSELAARLGVSTDQIAEAVRIATIGDIGAALAKFDVGDRQVPIRVQLTEAARGDRQLLRALRVRATSGAAVPLAALATFEMGQGPTAIARYDRQRQVTLGADLVDNAPLGEVVKAVTALPEATSLPEGVELKQFGDAEIMGEVFTGFAQAMGLGLMLVFAVLVLLFSSFLQPITILFSLPLSIGGAIFALIITQMSMSLPVVIGILMLMGIVTKNAIMLVDFALEAMARGVPRRAAIVDAGRKRARPIVMTTIAMVGGMLPAALALDSGGEFRAPMAVAVIGGLISSTVLSLVFVPAVFALMDEVACWAWRHTRGLFGAADEADAKAVERPVGSNAMSAPQLAGRAVAE